MDQGFSRRDYYKVLQVDPSAHAEVLHAAYRTLLRVLGKHPDLGGSDADARAIIEAYQTLRHPERRRAYDLWLKAHSAPPPAPVPAPAAVQGLPDPVRQWIRAALPDFHEAPSAPFASRFDLVLESPAPSSDRLYVKAFPVMGRAQWPTVFTLCRAVAVGRTGVLPSTDVVLVAAGSAEDAKGFLDESVHHAAQWSWNRCLIALCLSNPIRLRMGKIALVPKILRSLSKGASTTSKGA